jgi:glutathione S-transferase
MDTTTPNIKLTYFNVRGRADPIRLLLTDNDIAFEDVTIRMEEWYGERAKLKQEGKIPFNQVPLYEERDSGVSIVQSQAILRYLARKHDLYGQNATEMIRCDIIEEACYDAAYEIMILFWDKEFNNKREDYLKTKLPARLSDLNDYLAKNENDEYCVGSRVTLADYLVWNYLDVVRAFDSDIVKQYDRLNKFYTTFAARPPIKEFLEKKRCATITVPLATYGGTPDTS